MAEASTSYRAWGTKHASQTIGPLAVPFQWVRRHNLPARTIVRRLLTAIVNGSEHPSWRTNVRGHNLPCSRLASRTASSTPGA